MLRNSVKRFLSQLGYEIRRTTPRNVNKTPVLLHQYLTPEGLFDYDAYHRSQVEGNRAKIELVWVVEENIAFLSNHIKRMIDMPTFGICHGTRRGNEQVWFRKYLGCDVIGTEISDTAEQFPYTIRWDFHDAKPEWIDSVDFIYSNSFDHSYDPEKCLNTWMSCLKKSGLCIIEHTSEHGPNAVSERDPFGAEIVFMPYLITVWGKGQYGVRELIESPVMNKFAKTTHFIVIQRF